MAPPTRQSTNRRSVAEFRVWFRIVHVAPDGHHSALGDAVRERTVEIALGQKAAFEGGNVGTPTRGEVGSRTGHPRDSERFPKRPVLTDPERRCIVVEDEIEAPQRLIADDGVGVPLLRPHLRRGKDRGHVVERVRADGE